MQKTIFTLLFATLLTTLAAQNWQPMAVGVLPPDQGIFAVSAIGDNIVWAVASGDFNVIPASHKPWILRSSDGGQSWVAHPVAPAGGTISFQIVAVDSLTAWVTTQDFGGGAGRALYKTTDGGITWVKKLNNPAGGVALYRFADDQHWFAHNRQTTSRSSDNGDTWTNTTITGYQTNEFQILYTGNNLSNTAGDTVWSGTNAGRMLRFTDYGATREFFSTNLGSATEISSVAFQDHANGLCYSRSINDVHRISRSTDGGATWSLLANQPGTNIGWSIAAVPEWPGFYVLASNYISTGKVAITTNFGDSWTIETINDVFNGITFTSPTTGWIGASWVESDTVPAMFKYVGAPIVSAAIPTTDLPGFSVTPNPVKDVLRFDFEGLSTEHGVMAKVTDLHGRTLFSAKIQDNQLDVSQLPAGMYFLEISTSKGASVRKILRQ